ncbi:MULTISPECIES: AMP-binding protein [Paenibacillus]|uniref:AMP-binding protein n=1 Tax=Paenibacillus TaxID=44249 RepID=UPI0022B895C6|nr:AMP-binding protein [Paenibacillus caseinilyticus]MCZ8518981.1 AMP-binding protein [Paenibacillus caseinilyticus]
MSAKPWLAHYPAEVPPSYDYPKQHAAQFLLDAARDYPGRAALDFMGGRMSYAALLQAAYRFANAMRHLGVHPGDRVAIMLPNCPQAVIAYYGTLLLGGIVVMTNPMYTPRELLHQFGDAGIRTAVTLDLLYKRVAAVAEASGLRRIIVTSLKDYMPFPKGLLYPIFARRQGLDRSVDYGEGVYPWLKLLKSASPEPCWPNVDPDEDLALIQYTGGTTGKPKGVMLTHMNLVTATIQNRLWAYRCRPGQEVYLAALPFFHVFGLTVLMNKSVALAGTLALLPRFDLELLFDTMKRTRPTVFPGTPTMYISFLNDPRSLRFRGRAPSVCVSGAASLPLEVQQRFEALTGGRLIEGYGMTEASPVTHANPIWDTRKAGSIGIPFPDTDARVVDPETGEALPAGSVGELIVRGPQVMKGYWNRPEETAAVLKDGWLYTGDLGKMDEDGFFTMLDRKKDLIIAGGFNIYPREVEEVLYEHPEVVEAVVAGVRDAYRGETVKAYLVLKEGSEAGKQELDRWCRERLAAYKVPQQYEFRSTLPKSLIGKILRRALAEEEAEGKDAEAAEEESMPT